MHKLRFAAGRPERIWQQNHVGVWRRDARASDGAWRRVDGKLPSPFGFPIVAHPSDPDTAFVIPLQGAEFRAPIKGKLAVYKTTNGGRSWTALRKGLPSPAYVGILREAFETDGLDTPGLYFGTTGGTLFASPNEGKTWSVAAQYLPPILSVHAFVRRPRGRTRKS